jgi:hypothetical protein
MKTRHYALIYAPVLAAPSKRFESFMGDCMFSVEGRRVPKKGDIVFVCCKKPRLHLAAFFKVKACELHDTQKRIYEFDYVKLTKLSVPFDKLRIIPALAKANFFHQRASTKYWTLNSQQAAALVHVVNVENRTVKLPMPEQELPPRDVDATSPHEGRRHWKKHLHIERSKEIITRKWRHVLEATGRLRCEACGFDFSKFYKLRQKHFCEVHHLKPLAKLEKETIPEMKDLAILCSNCHRAIHLTAPLPKTIAEFREKYLKKVPRSWEAPP